MRRVIIGRTSIARRSEPCPNTSEDFDTSIPVLTDVVVPGKPEFARAPGRSVQVNARATDYDAEFLAERLHGRFTSFLTGDGRELIESRCRDALREHSTWLVHQVLTREEHGARAGNPVLCAEARSLKPLAERARRPCRTHSRRNQLQRAMRMHRRPVSAGRSCEFLMAKARHHRGTKSQAVASDARRDIGRDRDHPAMLQAELDADTTQIHRWVSVLPDG